MKGEGGKKSGGREGERGERIQGEIPDILLHLVAFACGSGAARAGVVDHPVSIITQVTPGQLISAHVFYLSFFPPLLFARS